MEDVIVYLEHHYAHWMTLNELLQESETFLRNISSCNRIQVFTITPLKIIEEENRQHRTRWPLTKLNSPPRWLVEFCIYLTKMLATGKISFKSNALEILQIEEGSPPSRSNDKILPAALTSQEKILERARRLQDVYRRINEDDKARHHAMGLVSLKNQAHDLLTKVKAIEAQDRTGWSKRKKRERSSG